MSISPMTVSMPFFPQPAEQVVPDLARSQSSSPLSTQPSRSPTPPNSQADSKIAAVLNPLFAKQPATKRSYHATIRTLLPLTEASSCDTPPEDKEDLKDRVKQHAYQRIQAFYLAALSYSYLAPLALNFTITVGGARLQAGQSFTLGYDAAHSNAAAGIKDDVREKLIEAISKNGTTPIIETFLAGKKFQAEDLAELHNLTGSPNEKKQRIEQIFSTIWPPAHSVFDHTLTDKLLNAPTTCLPVEANRQCDSLLEKNLREKIAMLFKQVANNQHTPESACHDYVDSVCKHFQNGIQHIQERIFNLQHFILSAEKCWAIEERYFITNTITEEQAKEYLTLLKNLKGLHSSLQEDKVGAPKAFRVANNRCLNWIDRLQALPGPVNGSCVQTVTTLWATQTQQKESFEILTQQLKERMEFFTKVRDYSQWELEGTQEPDYKLLAGKKDPHSGARMPLSPSSKQIAAGKLLRDATLVTPPERPNKRARYTGPVAPFDLSLASSSSSIPF